MQTPAAGSGIPRSRSARSVATVRAPPAESPAMMMWPRRGAAIEQPAVRRHRVLERGRKWMLGREPVVGEQHGSAGGHRDGGGQMAVRFLRGGHVTAPGEGERE